MADVSHEDFSFVQLDERARRDDRPSFHVFAEGRHSNVRGQILRLDAEACYDAFTRHPPSTFFVVTVISGELEASVSGHRLELRPLSQLALLPGTACRLTARTSAALSLVSFQAAAPAA